MEGEFAEGVVSVVAVVVAITVIMVVAWGAKCLHGSFDLEIYVGPKPKAHSFD